MENAKLCGSKWDVNDFAPVFTGTTTSLIHFSDVYYFVCGQTRTNLWICRENHPAFYANVRFFNFFSFLFGKK